MTDWVQWLTLGTSTVSAVGIGGIINERSKRNENRLIWERDHVTERYTRLYKALQAPFAAYAEHIEPALTQTPTPDLNAAWVEMGKASNPFLDAWADVVVVARPQVRGMLIILRDFSIDVFAPHTYGQGIPPIAARRMKAEIDHLDILSALLLAAIRLDLGLGTRRERRLDQAAFADVRRSALKSRAL